MPEPARESFASHLECAGTGARLPADRLQGLSPAGHPLLVRYDLERARPSMTAAALAGRAADMWRWREILPVASADIVSLGETETPLIPLDRTAAAPGALLVKDEGRLPTGSFKARGIAAAVAMAKRFGVTRLAMPTNGNAGAALAAYGARGGIEVTLFCPADTPAVNLGEMKVHGASVHLVDGLIDDCGRFVAEGAAAGRWFDLSTLKEPYRIEGKKTMGLELALQFGWDLPDVIFYPTGGGTGLIGMWKGFAELEALGLIGGKRPRMVAVQAQGCAPIVRAWQAGADHAAPWANAETAAAGIRVPGAIGDFLILAALRESGGFATAVSEAEIFAARDEAARTEGLLLCPEGAATLAAWRLAVADRRIAPSDRAVLFNCASGLKYPLPRP
ncbi:MAG TPA: threonine synthase [Allosphingosinicella sp.]|nr:threonine synthase [Allosphingosinicella sp.]